MTPVRAVAPRGGAAAGRTARARMRVAVLEAPRTFRFREVPVPDPGPGEVRVRLEGSGVCGSDLPLWQGRPWFDYPREPGFPGHEGWGTVDAVGPDVSDLREGDRVATLAGGAFAECQVIPAREVVPLPDGLEGRPFPGEPLACAMNVARRADLADGQRVAVVGVGFLGALLVELAARSGAWVVALSRRETALEVARKQGARETIRLNGDDAAAVRRVEELTDGRLCERVIEAAGVQRTLDLASALAGVRARLVIAGYHQDGTRRVDLREWNWRGLDVVNAHEREPTVYARGLRRAVEAVLQGRLDPFPLLTHHIPLQDVDRAFELLEDRPAGFVKAVVRP